MTTLNTKDFLESYKALQNAKYPTLPTNEHLVLSAILSVSIEWEKSLDDVQKLLDKKTQEQNLELQFFLDEKAGK
jgi:lipopolysaccharide biosynthesis regulator YciM